MKSDMHGGNAMAAARGEETTRERDRSRLRRVAVTLLTALAFVSASGAALAQPVPPGMGAPPSQPATPPSDAELLAKMIADLDQRLDLRPDQVEELRPILTDYVQALVVVRKGVQAEELSPVEALQAMHRENEKAADQVAPLLTPEQAAKYEKIQARQRARVAAELEAQRVAEGR